MGVSRPPDGVSGNAPRLRGSTHSGESRRSTYITGPFRQPSKHALLSLHKTGKGYIGILVLGLLPSTAPPLPVHGLCSDGVQPTLRSSLALYPTLVCWPWWPTGSEQPDREVSGRAPRLGGRTQSGVGRSSTDDHPFFGR